MTISCPRLILVGLPSLLPPVLPDKRKKERDEEKQKERENHPRPAESLLRHPPPWPWPPAAPQPPSRPPTPSPGSLKSHPREGLTPCAPCVGRVTSIPWPPVGPPSSPGTHWPRRGAVLSSFCTWPPHVHMRGPTRHSIPPQGTGGRTSDGPPRRGHTWELLLGTGGRCGLTHSTGCRERPVGPPRKARPRGGGPPGEPPACRGGLLPPLPPPPAPRMAVGACVP